MRVAPGAGGRSAGLLEFRHVNLAAGGIVYECGATAWGLSCDQVFLEAGGAAVLPHTVLVRDAKSYGHALFREVGFADAPTVDGWNVRIEPSGIDPARAGNVVALGTSRVWGPATVVTSGWDQAGDVVESPTALGQHTATPAHRRPGPAAVPLPNLVSWDPAVWATGLGGATITSGRPDPTGGIGGVRVAGGGKQIYRQPHAFGPGDFVFGGVWAKMSELGDRADVQLGFGRGVVGRLTFNPPTVELDPVFSRGQGWRSRGPVTGNGCGCGRSSRSRLGVGWN